MKKTMTLSSLKSSPSVFSTLKDIANLYSPTKDMDLDYERCKPKHQPALAPQNSAYCGPDHSNLR